MIEYTIKRIILAIVTIFVIVAITFFAMNAVPGGPFDSEKASSPQVKQVLMERYHLNEPVLKQFQHYVSNLLHGDLGVSLKTGRSISETIVNTFEISLKIGIRAMVLALIFGIILGSLAAFWRGSFIDHFIIFITTFLVSLPSFIIATILLYIFCMKLNIISVWSPENPNYILPVVALMVYPMANITKFTRTSMIDALSEDYIRTAKSKGVSACKIIFVHALRNALIPVITYVGPMTAAVLTGSFVIESIFSIGGLGMEFVNSINNRDYTMIMGTTIFLSTIVVLMSLISDLLYRLVDPRIKFD